MVRSNLCSLTKQIEGKSEDMNAEERVDCGECEYDEGGYFIIKGSEKVIVAQER